MSDHDDLDDVAQETWIRVAQALGSLRDEERFRPWLRAIARNACLTFLARRQPSDSLDAEDAAEPADRASDGPEASAELRDERRRMWEALGALPELDRRALYLREVESLPFEEVARRLGVRRNAAEVRVHRARTRFRQLYDATDATQPACGMAGIRLALLLEGELHGESAGAVEEHLTACAACTQRLKTMAQGRSLYRRMGMFALPGLTGLLERMQRAADALMRWVPMDAAPMLATNSAAPAAAVTGMTTAVVAAAVLVAPVVAEGGVLGFTTGHVPLPAVVAVAPPPAAAQPTIVLAARATSPMAASKPTPATVASMGAPAGGTLVGEANEEPASANDSGPAEPAASTSAPSANVSDGKDSRGLKSGDATSDATNRDDAKGGNAVSVAKNSGDRGSGRNDSAARDDDDGGSKGGGAAAKDDGDKGTKGGGAAAKDDDSKGASGGGAATKDDGGKGSSGGGAAAKDDGSKGASGGGTATTKDDGGKGSSGGGAATKDDGSKGASGGGAASKDDGGRGASSGGAAAKDDGSKGASSGGAAAKDDGSKGSKGGGKGKR